MKEKFYRNSDLKINKCFSLPQFKERIIEAKKTILNSIKRYQEKFN